MEVVHAADLGRAGERPALLVSLHDVSPLTRPACVQAVELLQQCGLPLAALTLFVVPFHEGKIRIDHDPETIRFLQSLAERGAVLVMHGLTHRMEGRAWTPAGWFRGHVFARGQGELFRCDRAETERRLDQAATILHAAGLGAATRAFVPPAWLLSPAARAVVERAGFDYYELFGGIVHAGRQRVRRVIGWGSLGALEARATALYAAWQTRGAPVDTRLAVHPVDVTRPSQNAAIRRALGRLIPRMHLSNYPDYLRQAAAGRY